MKAIVCSPVISYDCYNNHKDRHVSDILVTAVVFSMLCVATKIIETVIVALCVH